MEQKYRYGVIGTGWITEAYIQGAALTGQWELSAVCSRNAGRGRALADKYGARTVVTTPEELARTDVEAVYVASPNALHTAQSRKPGTHRRLPAQVLWARRPERAVSFARGWKGA